MTLGPVTRTDHRRPSKLAIEGWAPEYGGAMDSEQEEISSDQVDIGAELPAEEWRPMEAGSGTWNPSRVDFVDGVRRVEARVWITGPEESRLGICASYAAGVVRCGGKAVIGPVKVGRGFFGLTGVPDLETRVGTFSAYPVAEDRMEQLINGVQECMSRLESEVSGVAAAGSSDTARGDALVVLDGPLRGRQRMPEAIGYIKSHRVNYLPPGPREVVTQLRAGQRTPVFLIQTTWTRYSWYLRLVEGDEYPGAGIVRCEAWSEVGAERAGQIADTTALVLHPFASQPHKDKRAPQNLYPIAGLERELGRRLGDRAVVQRALGRAVNEWRG